jgi:hypothetical protein
MQVLYAIPARYIEELPDGTFVAVGIESALHVVQQVPTPLALPVLVALAASHLEDVEHVLQVRVLGPDLEEVAEPMEVPFRLLPGPNTPSGWDVRAVLTVGLVLQVQDVGTYSIELAADSASLSVPILVRMTEFDA